MTAETGLNQKPKQEHTAFIRKNMWYAGILFMSAFYAFCVNTNPQLIVTLVKGLVLTSTSAECLYCLVKKKNCPIFICLLAWFREKKQFWTTGKHMTVIQVNKIFLYFEECIIHYTITTHSLSLFLSLPFFSCLSYYLGNNYITHCRALMYYDGG